MLSVLTAIFHELLLLDIYVCSLGHKIHNEREISKYIIFGGIGRGVGTHSIPPREMNETFRLNDSNFRTTIKGEHIYTCLFLTKCLSFAII